MDIQTLRLQITDADLTTLMTQVVPADAPVTNLEVKTVQGAIQLRGSYPALLVKIPFTTTWEPSLREGHLCLRLASISVVGIPVGVLRNLFLGAFQKTAASMPGARVEGDALLIDVDKLLDSRGIPLRTNLKAIHCEPGQMIVEA